jgi:hypothetical protein
VAVRKTDLVKSVLLIVAGLTVLGIGIYLVKGGAEQFEPKVRYTIRFVNSGGLGGGDDVYLDGQKVGDVVYSVRIEEARRVDVIVEVRKDAPIPVDSIAIVTRSVTGTVAIEIISGASHQDLAPKGELEGQLPRSFAAIQDQVAELGGDFSRIYRRSTDVIADLQGVAGEFDFGEIRTSWDEATGGLGRVQETWQRLIAESEGPVGDVREGFERGVTDWRQLGRDVGSDWEAIRDKAETLRANYEEAVAGTRDVLADVDGVQAAYGDALVRFEAAAATFPAVAQEVREAVVESKPQVKRIVAEAEEGFARFKTLQSDLLRAPWKLLNKPSPEEVDAIYRFNALRLYFEAANEVSRTVEALDLLRRLGALNDPRHAELVEEVFERLRGALDGFDARQKRIVELLVQSRAAK